MPRVASITPFSFRQSNAPVSGSAAGPPSAKKALAAKRMSPAATPTTRKIGGIFSAGNEALPHGYIDDAGEDEHEQGANLDLSNP